MAKGNKIENINLTMRKIANSKKVRDGVLKEVEKKVKAVKNDLLREFNSHPVTQELDSGSSGSNSSGLLGGIGNLFGYIGFSSSSRPTSAVKSLLKRITVKRMKKARKVTKKGFTLRVEVKWINTSDIESVSRMPWEPGSGIMGIERGISGLGYYLNLRGEGRSKGGIQSKRKVRAGQFRTTKYLPAMLLQAEKILRSSK